MTKTTLYATRDFGDVGTERSFKAGEAVSGKDGELENYKAAGLVSPDKPEAAAKAGADSGKPA